MDSDRARALFALWLLFAINAMNFFDRQILAAVNEPIRKEWGLSDTELGSLGTAFTLLYAAVGVPLGRVADVWKRKKLLAMGLALWSALTYASGLCRGFWALFAVRLGVGIGEAACAPTANSLIGDLFRPLERARALSIFMLGLPVGIALSYIVGGTIAYHHGWRAAFFVAGAPGLILAALCLLVWMTQRTANGRLLTATLALAICVPAGFLALQQPGGALVRFMVFQGLASMMMYVYYATVYSTIHDIVEPSLRGTAMAIYFCAMYV